MPRGHPRLSLTAFEVPDRTPSSPSACDAIKSFEFSESHFLTLALAFLSLLSLLSFLICYGNTAGRDFKPFKHFDLNGRFEARPDPNNRRSGHYVTDTDIDLDAILCKVGFNQGGKTIKASSKEAVTRAIRENEDADDSDDEGDSDVE